MAYDVKLIGAKLRRWENYLKSFQLPQWNELPDMDLYMDQVVMLLQRYLNFLPEDEHGNAAITASITLSGEIGGSVVFRNLDFVGSGASLLIEDKTTAAPVADTVAIYDSNIHGIKALYDNSGKAVSNVL